MVGGLHLGFDSLLFVIEALQFQRGIITGLFGGVAEPRLLVGDGLTIAGLGLSEGFG